MQIVSAVTNSSRNSTAIDIVNTIYDYIKKGRIFYLSNIYVLPFLYLSTILLDAIAGTDNDKRINYQVISYSLDNGDSFGELDNMIQVCFQIASSFPLHRLSSHLT